MRRSAFAAVLLSGAVVFAAAPAGAGSGPVKRTVKLGDNYFSPTKLTVNRDSTITWRWPEDSGDVHDVALGKRPAGVKQFASDPASTSYSFKRKLTKPGRYSIICTLHEEEMRMTVTVRR